MLFVRGTIILLTPIGKPLSLCQIEACYLLAS